MPNTFSQLYIHVVFSVSGKVNLISKAWRENLYQYISGIVKNKGQKMMVINGVSDHVHILLSISPDCRLSDLMRDIKANSSRWINENKYVAGNFRWQEGYGAFSVSQSGVQQVIRYILNQEEHHRKQSFRDEYVAFLKAYEVQFDIKYLPQDYGETVTEDGEG